MPQRNRAPSFAFLTYSWVIFLTVLPSKVMPHTYPYEPTRQSTYNPKTEAWTWPWQ
uniref:ATP synthase complex subunit 8 n=1 Tax=Selaroides leptolepis TaxID=173311 RepID=A0A109WVK4_SELLE|nr:ATP synthase F0 subunit 8 [Selaroides leptolepis]